MVEKPISDLIMEKLSIENITNINSLNSELELERASNLFLKLRVLEKEDTSYVPLRKHLSNLIKEYENKHWSETDAISDEQVVESDFAEELVAKENEFYNKRKHLIRDVLKKNNLNQTDLARILGHRKGYISELINGVRPFSKEDIVILNRLFEIKLEDLIPRFIKQEKVIQIQKVLNSLPKNRLKISQRDIDFV